VIALSLTPLFNTFFHFGLLWPSSILQAEALATLLSGSALSHQLTQALGPQVFGFMAVAIMLPTVLLPNLEALSLLGALGVAAAAAVGLVVSCNSGANPGP
jgi:hypothetical protein